MTATPAATETRIELRGASGRLLGVLVNGCILEIKPKHHDPERVDLRPYLEAAGLCDNGREEVRDGQR